MIKVNKVISHYDFDGIVSAMLFIQQHGLSANDVSFVSPGDCLDGSLIADASTAVLDLPYIENVGTWFDHHPSNIVPDNDSSGLRMDAKSCARVIAKFYGIKDQWKQLLDDTDRIDSATLTIEDILNPQGYVLVSRVMGTNYKEPSEIEINKKLIELLTLNNPEVMFQHDVIKERSEFLNGYLGQVTPYLKSVCSYNDGIVNVDMRDVPFIFRHDTVRYHPYAFFPDSEISVVMFYQPSNENKVHISVGHNILNRVSTFNIGEFMGSLGGGGHFGVGGVLVDRDKAEYTHTKIMDALHSHKQ
jgi:hypothetical protein